MAYNGGYEGGGPGGRPYPGQGPQRLPPQRQYPPGPGGPQQSNGPPQQYDHYQERYGYGPEDYGNGQDQGYGGQQQYDDMNYQRGLPPTQDYPPQDYYEPEPGPGPGRGGRPPMPGPGGRGGPMRPSLNDGGRGGAYPPRGGAYPPGPGRGYPPQGRGGRLGPGPMERSTTMDSGANRRPPMNGPGPGPISPGEPGFGGGSFPTFPGMPRKTDLAQEQQIVAQMSNMEISGQRPDPRGPNGPPQQRGPMRAPQNGVYGGPGPMGPHRGPPQSYPPQDYPDQRRGPPPGPGYRPPNGYQDDGFGPPGRSMTMPARDPMQNPIFPPRRDSAPQKEAAGRGVPPRPNTAQAVRPPPQRIYPPNNGPPPLPDAYRDPGYDSPPANAQDPGYGGQQRPASLDDFYDYYDARDSYPPQNPPMTQSHAPDFNGMPDQRSRTSMDLQAQPGSQDQPQRGPGRLPEVNRTKSQPDLRNSQTVIFEMAGDIPPLPAPNQFQQQPGPPRGPPEAQQNMQNQYQQQPGPPRGPPDNFQLQRQPSFGQQGPPPPGPEGQQNFQLQRQPTFGQQGQMPPGSGLPPNPAPYRPGAPPTGPQGPANPDALPSHPTPVRPGHMPGSVVNLSDRPPPVRHYSGGSASTTSTTLAGSIGTASSTTLAGSPASGPPPSQQSNAPPPAKPVERPVTVDELEHLRGVIKQDPNDQVSALRLAKRLIEASDVLVPNLPDPKARARSRERYIVDAHKILRKLEKASYPDAMFFMADCMGRGMFSSEPDNAHAFSLYQSAAKLGHAAAAYRTAVCCEIGNDEGGGTRKDPLKAIQWYKRAATLGDTPAMYKVGMILLKGLLGQPRNPREAVSWLKRAAERADTENPHALHELALLYESAQPNDAILRDEAYAFQLFKNAAELGYKFSQFRLGCAYEYGLLGCPIDPRLSIMWYSRAATQEEHQSELALSGWYLTGSEGVLAQSDTEAYLWARKAATAGLAKAEYAMGYFTEVGIGVPSNLEDAKRWYWRAAAQDYPKARERLEDLKRAGKDGPRARERISRSKIGKQQEGECSLM